MNWQKLFDAQKGMQVTVESNHPRKEGEDRFAKVVNAFIEEVAETMQETRCFKFWSIKPPSAKEVILEEWSDSLHFLLVLGIELNVEQIEVTSVVDKEDINEVFRDVFFTASSIGYGDDHFRKGMYQTLVANFLLLTRKLGFTYEELENAYFQKQEINYKRQASGSY